MNSKNSKTSEPHRLSLNFSDKINLICCSIESEHVLHMEKYKKVIQKQ